MQPAVPAHGAIITNTDGTFVNAPDANYFGTDSFAYRLDDGPLEFNLAEVDVTVTQLMAVAYGASAKEAGLDGNIVRATRLEEIAAKK